MLLVLVLLLLPACATTSTRLENVDRGVGRTPHTSPYEHHVVTTTTTTTTTTAAAAAAAATTTTATATATTHASHPW